VRGRRSTVVARVYLCYVEAVNGVRRCDIRIDYEMKFYLIVGILAMLVNQMLIVASQESHNETLSAEMAETSPNTTQETNVNVSTPLT
ncbi:hypothetical protein C0J52_05633, partial [Blattella germanica]